ncbi:MAG: WD40/YVTN/BNR-like repeat-containing protein [Thermoplasmata archaeon]
MFDKNTNGFSFAFTIFVVSILFLTIPNPTLPSDYPSFTLIPHSSYINYSWVPANTSGIDLSNNQLRSVYFVNSTTGWAVGDNGMALKSTDGGNTWHIINLNTRVNLRSVYFTSPSTGWIVGFNGTILYSQNSGKDWVFLNVTHTDLNDVLFISQSKGFIVGNNGIILETNNGYTFKQVYSPTIEQLNTIFFVNDTDGWVAGGMDTILHTTDGGNTWTEVYNGTGLIYSIFFANPLDGYTAGNAGMVLYTKNGGISWNSVWLHIFNPMHSIYFLTPDYGWVIGYDSQVAFTTDGGISWNFSVNFEGLDGLNINDIFFLNSNQGYIVGQGIFIFQENVVNSSNYNIVYGTIAVLILVAISITVWYGYKKRMFIKKIKNVKKPESSRKKIKKIIR